MSYFATKSGITKVISKNMREDYKSLGFTITTDGNNPFDPYDYEMVEENRLEPIIINGESFVGYSSFYCINTKTYVQEPQRTYDGSIPDINNYETFIVPRVKVSFDYMTIYDFRRFLKAVAPNEFPVTYYDYETNQQVSYNMYIEPREMAKLYNIGYQIKGVNDIEISLIGTLNNMSYLKLNYYDNITNLQVSPDPSGGTIGTPQEQYIKYTTKDMVFGNWYAISDASTYTHNKPSTDTNTYKFVHWNTKPDDTGITYLANEVIQASKDLTLYAIWVVDNT